MTSRNINHVQNYAGSKYGADDRQRAVVSYLVHGNIKKAARTVNLPDSTLRTWTKTVWWPQLVTEVRAEKDSEIQAMLSRIVEDAGIEVQDRLKNGDVKLVKVGDDYVERRVPISAKDACITMGIAFDKHQLSRNLPTAITSQSTQENLDKAARRFEEIAQQYELREKTVVSDQ